MQLTTVAGRGRQLRMRRSMRAIALWSAALLGLSACAGQPPTETAHDWPADIGAPAAGTRNLITLENDGFGIGYDTRARRAAWVAFRLTPIHGFHSMPRPDFRPDPRLTDPPALAIYAGARYERGHMAPNYAISQLYGHAAQRATFYYSNIAPQRPRLNELLWQRLEEIEIDDIAPQVGRLWVLTGPVPGQRQRAPAAFYRIWLARGVDRRWAALAFLVPQRVRGDERLDRYVASIDAIEARTGLDFFAGLPAAEQQRLESSAGDTATFGFVAHACDAARYGRRWQNRDAIHLRYDRCGHGAAIDDARPVRNPRDRRPDITTETPQPQ